MERVDSVSTGSGLTAPHPQLWPRRLRPWLITQIALLATALVLVAPRLFDIDGSRFVPVCRMHVPSTLFASGNIDLRLADSVLYLIAIVAASGLLVDRWPRRAVAALAARASALSDRVFLGCVFAFVLLTALLISWQVFGHFPRDVDHVARVFQARTFASGQISLSAPARLVEPAFEAYGVVEHNGRWFAKYEPGGALAMALWLRVTGVTWGIHPLLGALAPLLFYGALRRWYERPIARLAVALMALSPFYAFMVASFHSHVPCLFFLSAYLFFVARAQHGTAARDLFLAGVFAGLAFTTRTYTTLLVAWPFALWLLWDKRRQSLVRSSAILAAGAALPLLALLAYNAALTGDPLLFPFHLADAAQKPWFGYKNHTILLGLVNTLATLKLMNLALFGWPASLLFVAVLSLLRTTRVDHMLLVSAFSLVAGYAAYYWSDFSNGPRYYFEALPALAVLSARGILAFPDLIDRLRIRDVERDRARDFAATLVTLSFAFSAVLYLPPLTRMYRHHYNANFDLALDATAGTRQLGRALVLIEPLPGQNHGFSAGFLANPLDLNAATSACGKADVIYARARGRRADRKVAAAYPGRDVYRLWFDPLSERVTLRAVSATQPRRDRPCAAPVTT
jgi:hypothetical protein